MGSKLSIEEMLSHLEKREALHREREAFHAGQEAFHEQQQAHQRVVDDLLAKREIGELAGVVEAALGRCR